MALEAIREELTTAELAKKYRIHLNAFETDSEARKGIGALIAYCNENRPHSSHGLLTPGEAYDRWTRNLKAAA